MIEGDRVQEREYFNLIERFVKAFENISDALSTIAADLHSDYEELGDPTLP